LKQVIKLENGRAVKSFNLNWVRRYHHKNDLPL
jgi:hypothetical protein